jgi:hypothetical protein
MQWVIHFDLASIPITRVIGVKLGVIRYRCSDHRSELPRIWLLGRLLEVDYTTLRASTAAVCQSRKSVHAGGPARHHEQLVSARKTGRAPREVNLVIPDDGDCKQLGKLFEDIRNHPVSQLRMLADVHRQQFPLTAVNGYRRAMAEKGGQMRKGNVAKVYQGPSLEDCEGRSEHALTMGR